MTWDHYKPKLWNRDWIQNRMKIHHNTIAFIPIKSIAAFLSCWLPTSRFINKAIWYQQLTAACESAVETDLGKPTFHTWIACTIHSYAKWEDNPKCRVCGEKVVVVRVGRGNGEGSGTLSHQWHSDLTSIMLIRLSLSLPLFSLWPAVTVGFSFSISWMPTIMISAHAVRCGEHVSTWPAACKCMSLKGRRIP